MNTTTKAMRKIVHIDEDKCNGCGECVPSCAEGAIEIIDGKARLVAENLCDGLGNCLGNCPMDAIRIEDRPADDFDEAAVEQRLEQTREKISPPAMSHGGGCPGSMPRKLASGPAVSSDAKLASGVSRLGQWPVQLTLVPEGGELWAGADVLIAADCVAFAMGNFHDELLVGKTLAIACPKLDNPEPYVRKLARIFAANDIASLKVARMEVPCCMGLVHIVQQALDLAGNDLKLREIVIGLNGEIQRR
jgi:NAD-dependent dihydropyrimidine dehydrogenase PreA subunit